MYETLHERKKPNVYSRKMSRAMEHKTPAKNKTDDVKRKVMIEPSKPDEADEKNTEKKAVMDTIIAELKDPNRDFNNFDPGGDQEIIRY